MNNILNADINDILSDENIPWSQLQDSTLLVTGVTGLIGGLLVRTLSAANVKHKLNIRLVGHGRNKTKGKALSKECGLEYISSDIRKTPLLPDIEGDIDYIFHCAALTKSADMLKKPIDVVSTEVDGTKNMLALALEKHCKSFVYLSSMEIYGQTKLQEVFEGDLGYLNLTTPRSSYPESKRLCEILCVAYASQHKLPVKIARLTRTFGAGLPNNGDMRVASQFARCAFENKDIELHTNGDSVANCCYTADTISGLLTILLKGKDGQAYNITNPEARATIREMAEIVAKNVCGGKIKVTIAVPEDQTDRGYAPDVSYTLNVDKLKALGWLPKHGLCDMYQRMIADWQ